jgi:hypothetical protein
MYYAEGGNVKQFQDNGTGGEVEVKSNLKYQILKTQIKNKRYSSFLTRSGIQQ